MKKIMLVFILFSGFLVLVGFKANAQDQTGLPNAGTKPGSFFYPFDKFFENLSLKLTFSDEKKAEKLSKMAEERLAELNSLDPKEAQKYANQLYNEYGLDIEKANLYLQNLAAEGKISDEKLATIQNRINNAENKKDKIKNKILQNVSLEIQNQVQQSISKSKMSIFKHFTDIETINQLHQEGYGYGELLKLQAISDISSTSIQDLLTIDNAVTTTANGKQVNINLILQTKNISQKSLQEKLKEYKDITVKNIKNRIKETSQNAETRKNLIKKHMNQ